MRGSVAPAEASWEGRAVRAGRGFRPRLSRSVPTLRPTGTTTGLRLCVRRKPVRTRVLLRTGQAESEGGRGSKEPRGALVGRHRFVFVRPAFGRRPAPSRRREGNRLAKLGPERPRERWSTPLPTLLEWEMQLLCSAGPRHRYCRRRACRRYRYCVPPRDLDHPPLHRCSFDGFDAWAQRVLLVEKVVERLMKDVDVVAAGRGRQPPFTPPETPDHLDLTKPLDVAALRAALADPSRNADARPSRRRRAP